MKGYLIDVKSREIKEVNINTWEDIAPTMDCQIFTCPHITAENDVLYCDDEGLLKEEIEGFFKLDSYPQSIAGNALILGDDGEGESVDAHIDLETLKSRVKFMSHMDAYLDAMKSYN